MANRNGPGDFGLGLLPIDVRVATFLAGIQSDAHSTSRSTGNQQPMLSAQQIYSESNTAQLEVNNIDNNADTTRRSRNQPNSTTNAFSRCRKGTGARKQRYRDDRQKLSNSLAQKRYRERKKRAFDELKELVDCMTLELQQLRHVKEENERLTLALEEYKQVSLVRDVCDKEKISNMDTKDTTTSAMIGSPLSSSPVSNQNSKMQSMEMGPLTSGAIPQPMIYDFEQIGTADILKHICLRSNMAQYDANHTAAARVEFLQTEWENRMSAVEQFFKFQQSYANGDGSITNPIIINGEHDIGGMNSSDADAGFGAGGSSTNTSNDVSGGRSSEGLIPLGPTSNDIKSVTKECMSSLYSLCSDLASTKLLAFAEEIQENGNRIKKTFSDFDDELKST